MGTENHGDRNFYVDMHRSTGMYHAQSAATMQETELITKSKRDVLMAKEPVEKLRYLCLSRGAIGILELGRFFRSMDSDGSKALSQEEFMKGMKEIGMNLTDDEIKELFTLFDTDDSGSINMDEFLGAVRPPMSASRLRLIEEAFNKMDKTGDGVIQLDDLRKLYSVKHHLRYLSGEESKEEITNKFLRNFEKIGTSGDDKVTREDFTNYYAGLSISIVDDGYFNLMMRQLYSL